VLVHQKAKRRAGALSGGRAGWRATWRDGGKPHRELTATSTSNGKTARADGKFNKQRQDGALPGKLHRDAKGAKARG